MNGEIIVPVMLFSTFILLIICNSINSTPIDKQTLIYLGNLIGFFTTWGILWFAFFSRKYNLEIVLKKVN